jgi:hypothetical protein
METSSILPRPDAVNALASACCVQVTHARHQTSKQPKISHDNGPN